MAPCPDGGLGTLARLPLEIRQRIYLLHFAYKWPRLAYYETVYPDLFWTWTVVDDSFEVDGGLPALANVSGKIRAEAFLPFMQTNVLELARAGEYDMQACDEYVQYHGIAENFASMVCAVSIDAALAFDQVSSEEWDDRVFDISMALQFMTNIREVTVKSPFNRITWQGGADVQRRRAEAVRRILRQVSQLPSLRHVRLWQESHLPLTWRDEGSGYLRDNQSSCEMVWSELLVGGRSTLGAGCLKVTLDGHCGRSWCIDRPLVDATGQMIFSTPKESRPTTLVCTSCISYLNRKEQSFPRKEAALGEEVPSHLEAMRRELGHERAQVQRFRQIAASSRAC